MIRSAPGLPRSGRLILPLSAALLVAACATTPIVASPSPTAVGSGSQPPTAPSRSAAPTPVDSGSPPPSLAPAEIPIRAGPDAIALVRMSTNGDGEVFVTIPGPSGAVLIRLSADGRMAQGWPVVLPQVVECSPAMPVAGGTIRVVCSRGQDVGHRAWAIDEEGRVLPGWPVDVPGALRLQDQRVIGDVLMVVAGGLVDQQDPTGTPMFDASVSAIDAAGGVHPGPSERGSFGIRWRLGPDGVAYGVEDEAGGYPPTASRIRAFGLEGPRVGWPVRVDLVSGAPSFGTDGRVLVTAADLERGESRVFGFLPDGRQVARSAVLPLRAGEVHSEGAVIPAPPVVADDGTMYVVADLDESLRAAALVPDGDAVDGWPWPYEAEAEARLVHPGYCPPEFELGCLFEAATPSVGPGGVLYLPLTDGSLLALDRTGRVRSGWPVGLRRDGSVFWAVITSTDGITYALAVEPEGGAGRYSASVLAIAPDSTVLSVTTIVEP